MVRGEGHSRASRAVVEQLIRIEGRHEFGGAGLPNVIGCLPNTATGIHKSLKSVHQSRHAWRRDRAGIGVERQQLSRRSHSPSRSQVTGTLLELRSGTRGVRRVRTGPGDIPPEDGDRLPRQVRSFVPRTRSSRTTSSRIRRVHETGMTRPSATSSSLQPASSPPS